MQWAKMEVVVIIDRYMLSICEGVYSLTKEIYFSKKKVSIRLSLITRREKCNIKAISEEKFAESVCSGPTVNYMSSAVKFRFH